MKTTILRRLQALEAAAERARLRPPVFLHVLELPDDEREAHWAADDALVSTQEPRHGVGAADTLIHTIVVDIHASARDELRATRHLTDAEIEAREHARDRAREIEWQAAREAEQAPPVPTFEPRPRAVIGWDRFGREIYDDQLPSKLGP